MNLATRPCYVCPCIGFCRVTTIYTHTHIYVCIRGTLYNNRFIIIILNRDDGGGGGKCDELSDRRWGGGGGGGGGRPDRRQFMLHHAGIRAITSGACVCVFLSTPVSKRGFRLLFVFITVVVCIGDDYRRRSRVNTAVILYNDRLLCRYCVHETINNRVGLICCISSVRPRPFILSTRNFAFLS